MLITHLRLRQRERGFLYRKGDFAALLGPGSHWIVGAAVRVEVHDTHQPELRSSDLQTLMREPAIREQVEVFELRDSQRALVWVDGRLHGILGKGRHAFWKAPHELVVEAIDATPIAFEHKALDAILAQPAAREQLEEVVVGKGFEALLFLNERFVKKLEAGRYAFWKGLARIRVAPVDLREQQLEVSGQEILTRDNVSLRLNLIAAWRAMDPLKMLDELANPAAVVYRELQLALRAHIGTHSLEALLATKDGISDAIRAQVAPRLEPFGMRLEQVGIKDVILPGEMKTILNRVIEAENTAKSNLILRREETAATRSLLNTAKLMENNPVLMRLKELEVAERIAERVGSIHITNGIDELVNRLVPPRPHGSSPASPS